MLKFIRTLTGNMHIYRLTHKQVDLAEQSLAVKTLFPQ